jgi:hypothetical protein
MVRMDGIGDGDVWRKVSELVAQGLADQKDHSAQLTNLEQTNTHPPWWCRFPGASDVPRFED